MAKKDVKHPGNEILEKIQKLSERDRAGEKIGKDLIKLFVEMENNKKNRQRHVAKCLRCREALAKTGIIIASNGW